VFLTYRLLYCLGDHFDPNVGGGTSGQSMIPLLVDVRMPASRRTHDYADVCVMPMFPGTPWSPGVGAREVSA